MAFCQSPSLKGLFLSLRFFQLKAEMGSAIGCFLFRQPIATNDAGNPFAKIGQTLKGDNINGIIKHKSHPKRIRVSMHLNAGYLASKKLPQIVSGHFFPDAHWA